MSDKREDYLTWDEYFMGVAMLWDAFQGSEYSGRMLYCESGQQDFVHGIQWISERMLR